MDKLLQLEQYLKSLGPVAVAVSGGVDSMTLAVVASRVNSASQIYHAVSPAVPHAATARVKDYANKENWQLQLVDAKEMDDAHYRANPVNRCYFCKSNLYATLAIDSELTIISGTNTDDLDDFRPGLKAAEEHKVVHPYVAVGIDKSTIRAIAKHLRLFDLHDLPAAPCLSSRVTTGIAIDAALLPVIDQVETYVWRDYGETFSLTHVRCRILPQAIIIQLQGNIEFENNADNFAAIVTAVKRIFKQAGFVQTRFETVSVEPYRQGSAFIATDGVYAARGQESEAAIATDGGAGNCSYA